MSGVRRYRYHSYEQERTNLLEEIQSAYELCKKEKFFFDNERTYKKFSYEQLNQYKDQILQLVAWLCDDITGYGAKEHGFLLKELSAESVTSPYLMNLEPNIFMDVSGKLFADSSLAWLYG